MSDPVLDTLSGGSLIESSAWPNNHSTILKSIDSLLRALSGPHAQVADDIASGRQPTPPTSFAEALSYLPTPMGGVRTPPPNLVSNQLKQLNKIIDWLNEAGIYSTVNRRPTGTSYINTQHPITREQHTIRVPQDTHYGSPIQQGETRRIGSSSVSLAGSNIANTARPGYYFDTGSSILNTNRLPRSELIGNVRGEPFADLNVLFDALANTYSRAPVSHRRGNWLVEPGREPHRGHRTTPVPMTNPPIMWGTRFTANNNPPVSALRKREVPRTLTEEQLELALEGIAPRRNILKLKKK